MSDLRSRFFLIVFEMEATGTMNRIPGGVIRGVWTSQQYVESDLYYRFMAPGIFNAARVAVSLKLINTNAPWLQVQQE